MRVDPAHLACIVRKVPKSSNLIMANVASIYKNKTITYNTKIFHLSCHVKTCLPQCFRMRRTNFDDETFEIGKIFRSEPERIPDEKEKDFER